MLSSDVVNYFLSSKCCNLLIGVLCYYLLYYNNLYYVKSSNILLGLETKTVVNFYADFTSSLLQLI